MDKKITLLMNEMKEMKEMNAMLEKRISVLEAKSEGKGNSEGKGKTKTINKWSIHCRDVLFPLIKLALNGEKFKNGFHMKVAGYLKKEGKMEPTMEEVKVAIKALNVEELTKKVEVVKDYKDLKLEDMPVDGELYKLTQFNDVFIEDHTGWRYVGKYNPTTTSIVDHVHGMTLPSYIAPFLEAMN